MAKTSAKVETISGTKKVAARMVAAEEGFLSVLVSLGGITKTEAERVLAYYRQQKMVRMDAVNGRLDVTHGAYLDRDVIARAATLTA